MSDAQNTAEIIPFPKRRLVSRTREKPQMDNGQRLPPKVEYGSGWYHDAAIADGLKDPRT
ncbi:MAG: DUF2735 domain-containing protein [Pseudomonadota bacterium]